MSNSPILDAIVAPGGLSVTFEAIMEVRGSARRLHGVSASIRGPRGTNVEDPGVLLEYARRKRAEGQLDRASVRATLEAARALPGDVTVCMKVHASTLGQDHEFISHLADEADTRGIALSHLVLEIVEQGPAVDGPCIPDALDALRHLAVGIALADVGLGQSSYRMVLDCRPNYFKVDGYVVQGARDDFYRRAVLESMQDLARKFGARVIAEGVAQEADLEAVTAAGIDLAQGALFSPPLDGWGRSSSTAVNNEHGPLGAGPAHNKGNGSGSTTRAHPSDRMIHR